MSKPLPPIAQTQLQSLGLQVHFVRSTWYTRSVSLVNANGIEVHRCTTLRLYGWRDRLQQQVIEAARFLQELEYLQRSQ